MGEMDKKSPKWSLTCDQDSLLELLRSCAWAPPPDPSENLPLDVHALSEGSQKSERE